MKIKNIKNKKQFFHVLEECTGKVELLTSDGDVLNLKSTLCQYLALTQMFDDDNEIECELRFSQPSDYDILKDYLILPEE